MSENYRVRVRNGDFEVEVESPDKAYVESKLEDLLNRQIAVEQSTIIPPVAKKKSRRRITSGGVALQAGETAAGDDSSATADIPGLISKIKDDGDYEELEKNVLDKKDVLAKIIACLHYAAAYTNDHYLTTGHIETITDQLGIKIDISNIGKKIRNNQRYFTAKTVRKKGQVVPYKLNRHGEQAFAKYLRGEKP